MAKRDDVERAKVALGSLGVMENIKMLAKHRGSDVVLQAIVEVLDAELPNRSPEERLAELAFNLQPGEIKRVVGTDKQIVRVPVIEENPHFTVGEWDDPGAWQEAELDDMLRGMFNQSMVTVVLQRWRADIRFGYDGVNQILFVYREESDAN